MLRPPSLSKPWDEFTSFDQVFVQQPALDDPPTDEQKAALEEYVAKLKAARETGDWTPMLAPGRTLNEATKFTFLQIDRNVWREVLDRSTLPLDIPNRIGPIQLRALVFRLALKSAHALDVKVERSVDSRWGYEMAQADIVSYLDSIDPRIIAELGTVIMERLRGDRPL